MPSMPEPASATAIGTPKMSARTSTSRGSATMCDLSADWDEPRLGGWHLFPEQERLAAADPRQVDEHEHGQGEETQGNEAIGRPDEDRQRAQRGVVFEPAPRLLGGCNDDDQAEEQRDEIREIVGQELRRAG